MDGTDFETLDKKTFDVARYSHKFNGPAVRYEVATSIQTCDIVWVNGPFLPSLFNDLNNFCEELKSKLLVANEKS